jgi:hypothetical protein
MTTASEMTVEHLGDGATQADLDEFRGWVRALMTRDSLDEEAATDAIWNDGDFVAGARKAGLS